MTALAKTILRQKSLELDFCGLGKLEMCLSKILTSSHCLTCVYQNTSWGLTRSVRLIWSVIAVYSYIADYNVSITSNTSVLLILYYWYYITGTVPSTIPENSE